MTRLKSILLPKAAYEALKGLKAQSEATQQMYPTNDKKTRLKGKKALSKSCTLIASHPHWVTKITGMLKLQGKCLGEVDAAWLEQAFENYFLISSPTTRLLPDGAYDTLQGLKLSAEAKPFLPPANTHDTVLRRKGMRILREAHLLMDNHSTWRRRILINLSMDNTDLENTDDAWLEKIFGKEYT